MSSSQQKKKVTPFAEIALKLDGDFSELEQLGGQIDRLDIESDSGLQRAKELLVQFSECGERIGAEVQVLSKELQDARVRSEEADRIVSIRANQIQARQQESDRMLGRFHALAEMVRKVSETVAGLKKATSEEISPEEKNILAQQLPDFDTQLGRLVDEAQKLRADAHSANLKSLERNADSLAQVLSSARRKLTKFVVQPTNVALH